MKESLFGSLKWWREVEKEEERKEKLLQKANKCYGCVWYHKESNFCPFAKCFKGKWGGY